MTPKGLSKVSAATFIGISPNTFDKLVKEGTMPMPHVIGSRRLWDADEVAAHFEELPRLENNNDDKNDWD